jgi:hypothetical protein
MNSSSDAGLNDKVSSTTEGGSTCDIQGLVSTADGWPMFEGGGMNVSADTGLNNDDSATMEEGNGSCRGPTFSMVWGSYMIGRGVADVIGLIRAFFVFG